MIKNYSVKQMVIDGLMVALVCLATIFTKLPNGLPSGYFNIGDTVIIVAAILFGVRTGFIAGAVGSCLADIFLGWILFAPATFIIKGLEGLIVAILYKKAGNNNALKVTSAISGALFMVLGYFTAEAFILSIFDKELGLTFAVAELLPNIIQAGVSVVLGLTVATSLIKLKIKGIIA